jgi:hypothetical protein
MAYKETSASKDAKALHISLKWTEHPLKPNTGTPGSVQRQAIKILSFMNIPQPYYIETAKNSYLRIDTK